LLGIASAVVVFTQARFCSAEEPLRRPLPESLLTESTTDIDAREAGELEVELNVAKAAARTGGAGATLISFEIEWRALTEVGLRFEPSYSRVTNREASSRGDSFGLSGALAFGLWHDHACECHLQGELLGRTPEGANARVFEPGEPELPVAADLLAAVRRGRWTVRATIGAEAGGAFAHAPLHTDVALLTGIVSDEHFGFVVIDMRADWAREAPIVFAPEIVADTTPLNLPFRLGVALPINVGVEPTRTSYGLFLRLMWIAGED
jgi:hypothetical protein